MHNIFFTDFLLISSKETLLLLAALIICFFIVHRLTRKKVNFAVRILIAMLLGLFLGLGIQILNGFPDAPEDIRYLAEASAWYGLFGNGFMSLVRMLVIPLVMISIIHVILEMEEGAKIGKLVRNTLLVTLIMVALAAVVGLTFGILFHVGKGMEITQADAEIKEFSSIVDTLANLIPANPVVSMVDLNVIALVIFSMFFGFGARRMHKKYADVIDSFYRLIGALHKIIISIAMSIIKLMPYAVVPLLANTIAMRGLASIKEVGLFILVIYLALAVMFVIQLIQLMVFGISPLPYLRKGIHVMILAFTSRSSVGVLPATIDVLTNELGVSEGSANFAASFGTTAGMQGCAGIFPALLVVFISNVNGTPIDITFLIMSVIVISLGSLGIAGIPGTATMAASVTLSGMGMAAYFPSISPILSIDPLIDMGRTLINVTGSITNTIVIDKTLGTFDEKAYKEQYIGNDKEDEHS